MILTYDLGTGGMKAALFDDNLELQAMEFSEYPTYYPEPEYHEQRPLDWWDALCRCTKLIFTKTGISANCVSGVALSGASLVAIPLDSQGEPLLKQVPIWSDMRAEEQAQIFFKKIPENEWYTTTGNGFPPACYSTFKLMWLRDRFPELFKKISKVVGSKDFINFLLTGNIATDNSYASGSGAYDLKLGILRKDYLEAANLPLEIFPEIISSHQQVGTVTEDAARQTGLAKGTPVFCGGVDNACMAMGVVGAEHDKAYISLGSSAWIPLNCQSPILDFETRPYTFAHLETGLYSSAYSLFSGGNSLRWARDVLCSYFPKDNAYKQIDALAAKSPAGANGVLFHPGLAGGNMQDYSPHLRGAFMNLQLGTTLNDLLRAVLEGVAMNLNASLQLLQQKSLIQGPLVLCGGGSHSDLWMQIIADVLDMQIERSEADQFTASFGAAALVAKGLGAWKDYTPLKALRHTKTIFFPNPANRDIYYHSILQFQQICQYTSSLGDLVYQSKKETKTK